MDCYVLILICKGIILGVDVFPYNPQGLKQAKDEAECIAITTFNPGNILCLYDCKGGAGSDILSMDEIMQWRKDAGLDTWI